MQLEAVKIPQDTKTLVERTLWIGLNRYQLDVSACEPLFPNEIAEYHKHSLVQVSSSNTASDLWSAFRLSWLWPSRRMQIQPTFKSLYVIVLSSTVRKKVKLSP
jgi:hypothetical protein